MTDASRKWWVLGAMGAALLTFALDETVVGVALPSMREDLGMSEVASHWVVNVYLLVLAGLVAAAGRLADIAGLRRVFVSGALIFAVASFASGVAPETNVLIGARAVQGLGAAMMLPTTLAMVISVFSGPRRGIAVGVYVACGGVGLALGPLVGGALTEAVSWRWIFFVNVPICVAIVAIIAAAWTPRARGGAKPRIDAPGLVLLIVGLTGIVAGVMQGETWGWTSPATIAAIGGGALALLAFTILELRTNDPLIEIRLFAIPTFTGSNLGILTGQMTMSATVVFLALYLQDELGLNPLVAGLGLAPGVIVTIAAALLAGPAASRFGPRRPLLVGLAGTGVALLLIAVATTSDSYWPLVPGLVLWGATVPFVFAPGLRAVQEAVPADMQGEAGGIARTSQMIGGTLGIACFSALLLGGMDFVPVFAAAGVAALATFALGLVLIDRRPAAGSGP